MSQVLVTVKNPQRNQITKKKLMKNKYKLESSKDVANHPVRAERGYYWELARCSSV